MCQFNGGSSSRPATSTPGNVVLNQVDAVAGIRLSLFNRQNHNGQPAFAIGPSYGLSKYDRK